MNWNDLKFSLQGQFDHYFKVLMDCPVYTLTSQAAVDSVLQAQSFAWNLRIPVLDDDYRRVAQRTKREKRFKDWLHLFQAFIVAYDPLESIAPTLQKEPPPERFKGPPEEDWASITEAYEREREEGRFPPSNAADHR
jgi:hypothetical protein